MWANCGLFSYSWPVFVKLSKAISCELVHHFWDFVFRVCQIFLFKRQSISNSYRAALEGREENYSVGASWMRFINARPLQILRLGLPIFRSFFNVFSVTLF